MSRTAQDHDPAMRAFLDRMAEEVPAPTLDVNGVVRRARRRIALTILASLSALALAVTGSAVALDAIRQWDASVPADRGPAPTVPEPEVEVVGRFRADDLERLVLRRGEQPAGRGLRFDSAFVASAVTVGSSIYVPYDELQAAGFVDSNYSLFMNRAWSGSVPGERGLDLLSWAMLFESPLAAHGGFVLVSSEPTEAEVRRWTSAPVRSLGDEGSASSGIVDGFSTTAYVWRVDNVVLFLASQGGQDAVPLDVLRELAELMTARAA